jgi:SWI/SNF-related matrix-associated actin-dependent regulator of chromatin subfamily A3
MGQTKEVTTIRFVMADTFEKVCGHSVNCAYPSLIHLQRVVETQQRKRELAELLLSPGQHAESEHSLDRLRVSQNPFNMPKISLID